jgi:hypothetical protein
VFYHVKLYVYEYTNNLRGLNELQHGRVMAHRQMSAEWCILVVTVIWVVTTFRSGLLLFLLLFITITMTWCEYGSICFKSDVPKSATKMSNVVLLLLSLVSPSTLTQTVNVDLDDAIVSSSGGGGRRQ